MVILRHLLNSGVEETVLSSYVGVEEAFLKKFSPVGSWKLVTAFSRMWDNYGNKLTLC